ncbi:MULTISPECIES: hypothetical protein [Niastella]|nr:hypothetical protein [Niastella soli]
MKYIFIVCLESGSQGGNYVYLADIDAIDLTKVETYRHKVNVDY